MKVEIKKIAAVEGGLPAASKEEYIPGTGGVKGHSIPVEYSLTGNMPNPLRVGECVFVMRETRNGIKCPGMFQTTPVTAITDAGFTTKNSIYLLTVLSEKV